MITYNPKSGTLNKYIPVESAKSKNGHYQEIQFGQQGYNYPTTNRSNMGVIVST
jgi:hypothetical protein